MTLVLESIFDHAQKGCIYQRELMRDCFTEAHWSARAALGINLHQKLTQIILAPSLSWPPRRRIPHQQVEQVPHLASSVAHRPQQRRHLPMSDQAPAWGGNRAARDDSSPFRNQPCLHGIEALESSSHSIASISLLCALINERDSESHSLMKSS